MKKLVHIYDDADGITRFNRYFGYLNSVKNELPEGLLAFATNEDHYALNSSVTLHDSWLRSLDVKKEYSSAGDSRSVVTLKLLHAMHESVISLVYSPAAELSCQLTPTHWPDRPVDLLIHEFSMVEPGKFRHFVQFDRGVWIEIFFHEFAFNIDRLEPAYCD